MRDKIPDNAWLITHRPLNGMFVMPGSTQSNVVSNKVLQLALGDELPASVRMIVSGHMHFFQAVDFAGVRPPQLVVGTGGDEAEVMPPETLVGADINGAKVVNAASHAGFGYMVWDRLDKTTWNGHALRCRRQADRTLPPGGSSAQLRSLKTARQRGITTQ